MVAAASCPPRLPSGSSVASSTPRWYHSLGRQARKRPFYRGFCSCSLRPVGSAREIKGLADYLKSRVQQMSNKRSPPRQPNVRQIQGAKRIDGRAVGADAHVSIASSRRQRACCWPGALRSARLNERLRSTLAGLVLRAPRGHCTAHPSLGS